MPIYEYECKSCGHRLEMIQKVSDSPVVDCPRCEQPELKKLISAVAFRLKGSGWYETDFKAGSKKNLVEGEKKTDSAGGDKPDKTPETKKDSAKDSAPATSSAATSKSATSR